MHQDWPNNVLPIQVQEANKLLKKMPRSARKKGVNGVPVFGAQNLDIAIATKDGIKWYVVEQFLSLLTTFDWYL